ncbi:hypothetical protein ACFRFL_31705 [Streptomyces sp. NPDC056708]|uniref:hypothetical protein n=1 Tax=unclassified Streptomyces TaxID=2593676 RepID=UPI0036B71DFA
MPKTAVIAGGGALAVWEPAFTLGAYNVIFYHQMLTLWAVSTAVLPAGLLMRERGPRHGRVYWACLALPSAWLGLAAIVPRSGNWQGEALFVVGGVISIIGTPLLTWVLLNSCCRGIGALRTPSKNGHRRRRVRRRARLCARRVQRCLSRLRGLRHQRQQRPFRGQAGPRLPARLTRTRMRPRRTWAKPERAVGPPH